jgi:hypothetical protein
MALPTIEFDYLGQVHSPFSGLPAELKHGGPANESDPTLLFIYYGMAGTWDYASPRLPGETARYVDNLEPADLAESLEIDGAIMMVVNTDWNGVNYYGFAPTDNEDNSYTDSVESAGLPTDG